MGYHPEAPQPEIIFNISHLCCYQLHTILIAHLEKHIRLHLTPAYLSARVCHDRIRNKGYEKGGTTLSARTDQIPNPDI